MKKQTVSGSRQKGMSTIGIIAVVGIFGLLLVTFFKVFPMYYGNIQSSVGAGGIAAGFQGGSEIQALHLGIAAKAAVYR